MQNDESFCIKGGIISYALSLKGETIEEITATAEEMRRQKELLIFARGELSI